MEIVIIGTGNTASVLGHRFKAAGHKIVQVFGRNGHAASALAYELETESTVYWAVVSRSADIYLLAVSDIAIAEVMKELHLPQKTIVHTAASVSKMVLATGSAHFGVLYPLQTLKKEDTGHPDIPIIIDASDDETLQQVHALAATISTRVLEANDETRAKLHVAAVFCNNFVNHLYTLMERYCREEGLDFDLLKPLIRETAERIQTLSPESAQTGPAARNDTGTLQRHLQLLQSRPQLRAFYELFTASIARHADL